RPWQTARFDGLIEGRGLAQARVALAAFYVYFALGILGLVALRRRRRPIWPYLVLAAVVTFTAAISFGVQRYRIPVDAVLPALAAVGLDALLGLRDSSGRGARDDAQIVGLSVPFGDRAEPREGQHGDGIDGKREELHRSEAVLHRQDDR